MQASRERNNCLAKIESANHPDGLLFRDLGAALASERNPARRAALWTASRPAAEKIDAAMHRVLESTAFILGREVEDFERAFAAYCGAQHAIGVASGTAALHLALLACGVEPGDEVITTPHTFIATAEAISHAGAHPVFVDIDPTTCNLDPALVEAAIGPRTECWARSGGPRARSARTRPTSSRRCPR